MKGGANGAVEKGDGVEFEDKTLLAFTDPEARATVLSSDAVRAVVHAAYRIPMGTLGAQATPHFDSLEYGRFRAETRTEIQQSGYSIRFGEQDHDPSLAGRPDVDLLWRGAVTASTRRERAVVGVRTSPAVRITDLDSDLPDPPPADPQALDRARRAALLARLRAAAIDPDAMTEAVIDGWVRKMFADSLSQALARAHDHGVPLHQIALSFAPVPGSDVARARRFPVAAAVLIRDPTQAGFRLSDFLRASHTVLEQMQVQGVEPPEGDEDLPKGRPVVLWLVPEDWFDDEAWPAGENAAAPEAARLARITHATSWLAGQGIALAPVGR
ncbi:hypothetical protein C882_1772 [Caenispirillum salinarum AK4]|uniref:Uncharacterized protein n=1 Tax=Caenispirillum salinarum AK4 TaxID=1238182 RepID=K9GMP2_9PROT|nr:hypothetical protein [Caenispirillum salinarum]EKV27270.1 hypothetical protein C882_1772 [Caenispirillum salinarum AK4]